MPYRTPGPISASIERNRVEELLEIVEGTHPRQFMSLTSHGYHDWISTMWGDISIEICERGKLDINLEKGNQPDIHIPLSWWQKRKIKRIYQDWKIYQAVLKIERKETEKKKQRRTTEEAIDKALSAYLETRK